MPKKRLIKIAEEQEVEFDEALRDRNRKTARGFGYWQRDEILG